MSSAGVIVSENACNVHALLSDVHINFTLGCQVFTTDIDQVTEIFINVTEVFLTLTEGFPCFFLSCKANARVKLAKTGHGPHSSTLFVLFGYMCCSVVICVVRLLFVLFCVLFVCKCVLPPGDKPNCS